MPRKSDRSTSPALFEQLEARLLLNGALADGLGDDAGSEELAALVVDAEAGGLPPGTPMQDLGDDAPDGTAEMVYDTGTGQVWFDNGGSTINLIELSVNSTEGLALDPSMSDSFFTATPNVDTTTTLQYFVPAGLPTGEDQVGGVGYMTTGLTELIQGTHLLFRYQVPGETLEIGLITIIDGGPAPTGISGTKFHDENGNGVFDAGEPGLEGWTIRLFTDDNDNDVLDEADTRRQAATINDLRGGRHQRERRLRLPRALGGHILRRGSRAAGVGPDLARCSRIPHRGRGRGVRFA